jgi:hypothetical protein
MHNIEFNRISKEVDNQSRQKSPTSKREQDNTGYDYGRMEMNTALAESSRKASKKLPDIKKVVEERQGRTTGKEISLGDKVPFSHSVRGGMPPDYAQAWLNEIRRSPDRESWMWRVGYNPLLKNKDFDANPLLKRGLADFNEHGRRYNLSERSDEFLEKYPITVQDMDASEIPLCQKQQDYPAEVHNTRQEINALKSERSQSKIVNTLYEMFYDISKHTRKEAAEAIMRHWRENRISR